MKTSSSDASTVRTRASGSSPPRRFPANASTVAASAALEPHVQPIAERLRIGYPWQGPHGVQRRRSAGRHHFHHAAGQMPAQTPRLVDSQHLPLVHQRHARAAFGFVQIRCGHHDGDAPRQELRQQLPELAARHRVHARRRLVQHHQFRLMDERAGQRQLLLHAARQAFGQPLAERGQARHLEQLLAAWPEVRNPVDLGEELDVLVDGQVAVEREPLRQVAHPLGDHGVLAGRVRAQHAHRAGIGVQEAAQQPDGRGLAGAVRPDQPEHLAFGDVEAQPCQRRRRAEALVDRREAHRVAAHCSTIVTSTGMPCLRIPAELSTLTLMR